MREGRRFGRSLNRIFNNESQLFTGFYLLKKEISHKKASNLQGGDFMEEWTKGWKGTILFTIWAILLYLTAYHFMGGSLNGLAFEKEFVGITLDSTKRTITPDIYMYYRNKSDKPRSIKLFYPIANDWTQTAPKKVVMKEAKGSDADMTLLFPTIKKAVKNPDFSQITSDNFEPKKFERYDSGIFIDLSLKPHESAIVYANFTQPPGDDYAARLWRSESFRFNFTMNGGWGRNLEHAEYVIKSDKGWEVWSLKISPNSSWHSKDFLQTEGVTHEKIKGDKFDLITARADNFLDRGLTIIFRGDKK